ncbi:MAG: prephenate dehydratase [Candidatus Altiarchaeota archaeon]|nr:prephenate dehydratase [Candidatus Altiarchaeota archaeon]
MSEKIAVLGPKGTFSEKAAKIMYPQTELMYLEDVDEVFRKVDEEGIIGVAAYENSLEGSVGATLECLEKYDLYVVGSTTINIDLYLMAPSGVGKDAVKVIMSHSHALAQCKKNIKQKYPNASTQAVSSTSEAMKEVKKRNDAGALGLLDAGKRYGLKILEEHMQDENSQTKFISISKNKADGAKTSVIFAVKDEPGALYSIVKEFAIQSLNMTKIESRPSRKKLGEYKFFVDYQNNGMREEDIVKFHDKIKAKTTYFKNLGSY